MVNNHYGRSAQGCHLWNYTCVSHTVGKFRTGYSAEIILHVNFHVYPFLVHVNIHVYPFLVLIMLCSQTYFSTCTSYSAEILLHANFHVYPFLVLIMLRSQTYFSTCTCSLRYSPANTLGCECTSTKIVGTFLIHSPPDMSSLASMPLHLMHLTESCFCLTWWAT